MRSLLPGHPAATPVALSCLQGVVQPTNEKRSGATTTLRGLPSPGTAANLRILPAPPLRPAYGQVPDSPPASLNNTMTHPMGEALKVVSEGADLRKGEGCNRAEA